MRSAEKKSMLSIMKRGGNILFCPGGLEELSIYEHGKYR